MICADVRLNGRASDGGVFNRSKLGEKLEESLNLPEPLPNREFPVPYVFIGKVAFVLQFYFMKPFAHKQLDLLINSYVTIAFLALEGYQKMYLVL